MRAPLKDRGHEFIACSLNGNGLLSSWFKDSRIGGVCNHSTRGHIENDLRRVLAYSLINQVGFMVVGVGIGTELDTQSDVYQRQSMDHVAWPHSRHETTTYR